MLRLTTVITCLLLVVISCSKAKQAGCAEGEGTDPRTGKCLSLADPNASRIATLQARLDAHAKEIQEMIREKKANEEEIAALLGTLDDPEANQSQKDKATEKLGELGIDLAVATAAKGGQAFLKWFDDVMGNSATPTPTQQPTNDVAN